MTRHPGLNTLSATKREQEIEKLREQYPQEANAEIREEESRERYQKYVKEAYHHQGRGHYDYAKLFVERAVNLLNEKAGLGYVLPRQSLVLGGWKKLRQLLLDDSELTVLQARNGSGWIFEDVEHRYMVVFLTQSSADENAGAHIWPAAESETALDEVSLSNALYLSYEDLSEMTSENHLVIPWFDNERATDILPKLQSRPRLSSADGWISAKHDSRWDFRGSGRHGDLAVAEEQPDCWKILMTRHVDSYKINEEKQFRKFVDPEKLLGENNGAVEKDDGTVVLGKEHPTIVFRHPSRNDDRRTLIASPLPDSGFILNAGSVHAIHASDAQKNEELAFLAYMNSFACDWWARRIVDRHVTSPVINNLPIPNWTDNEITEVAEIAAELIQRNGIETLPGGSSVPSNAAYQDMEEDELRARIEAVVAAGFELGPNHYDTILDDFSKGACSDTYASQIRELVASRAEESVSGGLQ